MRRINQRAWKRWATFVALALAAVLLLTACGDDGAAAARADGRPLVVTTTTHIADFARQVAGDRAHVTSLLPSGADPHGFEPAPRDVERIADADVVLRHGLGLDAWTDQLISASGTRARIHVVTEGVTTYDNDHVHEHDHGDDHGHDVDPHVWFDINNAKIMVENVRDALTEADPAGRDDYAARAAGYLRELDALDAWIREQIDTIPPGQRMLVTTHDAFGYYVRAYGLEQIGAIIPGLDTHAQPSARGTARLIDLIQEYGVQAIFAETTINPNLARRIAEEAGVTLIDDLYSDTLGKQGSEAATYIGMMRWNTTRIVEALR